MTRPLPHPAIVLDDSPQLRNVIEGLEAGTYPQPKDAIWRDDLPQHLAIRLARATGAGDGQIAAVIGEAAMTRGEVSAPAQGPEQEFLLRPEGRGAGWYNLSEVAHAWGSALPYENADPRAPVALDACEMRLRELHPYAMGVYDHLRKNEGLSRADAMRTAAAEFLKHPRPCPAPKDAVQSQPAARTRPGRTQAAGFRGSSTRPGTLVPDRPSIEFPDPPGITGPPPPRPGGSKRAAPQRSAGQASQRGARRMP